MMVARCSSVVKGLAFGMIENQFNLGLNEVEKVPGGIMGSGNIKAA